MSDPLVSVIIPIYNTEKYLGNSLDSVIGQSYKNIEILLVDDGSTDQSAKICEEYAGGDSRIKVLYQTNQGQAAARNHAMKYAAGDFFVFADSDDILAGDHIEYLVMLAKKYGADLVQGEHVKFRGGFPKADKTDKTPEEFIYTAEEALREFSYQRKFSPSPWGKLIAGNIIRDMEFPVATGYEDMVIMYRVIGNADKIIYSNKIIYYYRQHSQSTMHNEFSDKKIDRIRNAEKFLQYIKLYCPKVEIAANTRYALAQLQLLMELPFDKKYKAIKKRAFHNLKVSRKIVLRDKYAPAQIKTMLWTSYAGPEVLMILGRCYKKVTNR